MGEQEERATTILNELEGGISASILGIKSAQQLNDQKISIRQLELTRETLERLLNLIVELKQLREEYGIWKS
jgi:hypothetical protein